MLLSACSQKQTEPKDNKEMKEKETAKLQEEQGNENLEGEKLQELLAGLPEPTMTEAELINASSGPYSSKRFADSSTEEQKEIMEKVKELPKLGENPTDDEIELYWRKILSLFHGDYPNPAEALNQVAVETFGDPELEDERYQFKERLNVQILLDSSGSMGKMINGKTMMNIAKESIKEFAASLPEGANIALRVYGHKGSGSNQDKEMSCKSNELVYKLGSYDPNALNNSLNQFNPAGWTPLARAIQEAKNDLASYKGENNTNIIYIVSDGVETCDGNPVAEAKKLADSDIQPIVNVIGFDLDTNGQQQLKDVAAAAKGIYSDARNQEELKKELQKAETIAKKWEEWKMNAINTVKSNKYDQYLKNIPSYNIKWSDVSGLERTNILDLLAILRDKGQISNQAYQLLSDKRKERFSLTMQLGDQIEKELRQLVEQNTDNVIDEINKKYESKVDTNKNN